jgi:hypothetical protein
MKKLTILAMLVAATFLMAACGGGEDTAAEAEQAAPAAEEAMEAVAVHDCDGGCGMKAQPEETMTEIDGKWYCAGCVEKAKAEAAAKEGGHG